jgi:hypothetical protein
MDGAWCLCTYAISRFSLFFFCLFLGSVYLCVSVGLFSVLFFYAVLKKKLLRDPSNDMCAPFFSVGKKDNGQGRKERRMKKSTGIPTQKK